MVMVMVLCIVGWSGVGSSGPWFFSGLYSAIKVSVIRHAPDFSWEALSVTKYPIFAKGEYN